MSDSLFAEADASEVLAAALKQMDEIINGSNETNSEKLLECLGERQISAPQMDIHSLTTNLKLAVEQNGIFDGNGNDTKCLNLDKSTVVFLLQWLRNELTNRESQ
ncbi:uncharacterized protein LOC129233806, partial [Uloborus diversus]